ncbi:MAG: WG repeat-containing protein [Bacteroidota bacterium]
MSLFHKTLILGIFLFVIFDSKSIAQQSDSLQADTLIQLQPIDENPAQPLRFEQDEKYGYKDAKGTVIIEAVYDKASPFADGLARVGIDGKFGFIDHTGATVVPLMYQRVLPFHEGVAVVQLDGAFGLINREGGIILRPIFDQVASASEGLVLVKHQGKAGFFDLKGTNVIPLQYSDAWPFVMGKARVQQQSGWIYIDKEGNCIADCE